MKFAIFGLIAFAGNALTAPIGETRPNNALKTRDSREIERSIAFVHNSVTQLGRDISNRSIRPRPGDFRAAEDFVRRLLDSNVRVLRDIRDGDNAIRRDRSQVAITETLQLQNHLNGLKSDTDKVVQGWIEIKSIVDYARLTRDVHDALVDCERATGSFADAMVQKLPGLTTQFLGSVGRQAFISSIERAVQIYRR